MIILIEGEFELPVLLDDKDPNLTARLRQHGHTLVSGVVLQIFPEVNFINCIHFDFLYAQTSQITTS
ncbi:MAG TPA: hypothetical protein VKB95_13670 [Chitinophagaceae bacterium]|nr:hypothetical protein [Chitinophagaceae bacterium]